MPSPTLKVAVDRLLGDADLDDFVQSRRAEGVSWRRIGVELRDAIGVDVSHETLRDWFKQAS